MLKLFFQLFLFSTLSFSQSNDLINIFNIPLGLSMEKVQERWDCNNFNKYANLVHKTEDVLKYEGKKDSFFLGAIFYFVNDSLYMFVVSTKQTFNQTMQMSALVSEIFGVTDSVSYQIKGQEGKNSFQKFKTSYWSKLSLINNSVDKISTSLETVDKKLNVFSFSKFNSELSSKAKLLNKHQLKL